MLILKSQELRSRIEKTGLTIPEFAQQHGFQADTIRKYCRGVLNAKRNKILQLANALHCELKDISETNNNFCQRNLGGEGELIKIIPAAIGDEEINAVNARDLWRCLKSKRQFGNWIKDRLEGFVEGQDYAVNKNVKGKNGRFQPTEYIITLDAAKHIAMLERNEQGCKIRQYFIEVEKQYRKNAYAVNQDHAELDIAEELLSTTQALVLHINRQLLNGVNLPAGLLNYARTVCRTFCAASIPILPPVAVDPEIMTVMDNLRRGVRYSRNTVYQDYCSRCSGVPKSQRAFWPCARKYCPFADVRTAGGRYIILED